MSRVERLTRFLATHRFNWLDYVGTLACGASLAYPIPGLTTCAACAVASTVLGRRQRRVFNHWTDSNAVESWFEDRGHELVLWARKPSPLLPAGEQLQIAVRMPKPERALFAEQMAICPEDRQMVELKRRLLETEQRLADMAPEERASLGDGHEH